jgi:glucosamine--fructose-6-phosphate aminotransferase (isomerizing)
MCGIVGYVGEQDAAAVLIPALRRLEYRGYDSAGIATIDGNGLETCKAVGKIASLEARLAPEPPHGHLGIAHTRWATHGTPTVANAHPHVDCRNKLAIVHNGIIENYRELRRDLTARGHFFQSQTDTEVIAHLIEQYSDGGLFDAVCRAAQDLQGSYAVACISADAPDRLVAVRRGTSPLVIGYGDGEHLVASDTPALVGRVREMTYVGEGEAALVTRTGVTMRSLTGATRSAARVPIHGDAASAERAGYPHFMLKEIFEQPDAVWNTIRDRLDVAREEIDLPEFRMASDDPGRLHRLVFVACGSSYHASLVGAYLVEAFARIPVQVEIASEFRYRQPVLDRGVLTVAISQSGETADTLAALRHARQLGSPLLAICNVVGSSIAREADVVVDTRAGLEIGVASTKAFVAQLAAVCLLALRLGGMRRSPDGELRRRVVRELQAVRGLMERVLELNDRVRILAERFAHRHDFLYLGRGLQYPLALEGALKLKEISYVHAEGHAAGEMKHGPIALIDRSVPVVAIAQAGPTYDKMAGNIEEVRARNGIVIAVATEGDDAIRALTESVICLPPASPWIQPLLVAIPLQLLAYHIAVLRGCDVDQPRNLAKSVTVE